MYRGGVRWFTQEEIASWPPQHKRCRTCNDVKPLSAFHAQKQTLFGVNNHCKICRRPRSRAAYQAQDYRRRMLHRCKSRATKRDLAFDLTLDDIVIPSHCPALGIPLSLTGGGWDAPSVDRIDPAKGYIRGNIAIISTRANTIKNNATADEIMAVANWLREI